MPVRVEEVMARPLAERSARRRRVAGRARNRPAADAGRRSCGANTACSAASRSRTPRRRRPGVDQDVVDEVRVHAAPRQQRQLPDARGEFDGGGRGVAPATSPRQRRAHQGCSRACARRSAVDEVRARRHLPLEVVARSWSVLLPRRRLWKPDAARAGRRVMIRRDVEGAAARGPDVDAGRRPRRRDAHDQVARAGRRRDAHGGEAGRAEGDARRAACERQRSGEEGDGDDGARADGGRSKVGRASLCARSRGAAGAGAP